TQDLIDFQKVVHAGRRTLWIVWKGPQDAVLEIVEQVLPSTIVLCWRIGNMDEIATLRMPRWLPGFDAGCEILIHGWPQTTIHHGRRKRREDNVEPTRRCYRHTRTGETGNVKG